ncbi:metal ABC transporter permease [Lacticaseibacillus nasuensis]|uniref:Cation ABC superfamily ATP binding cassette transporter, membrane protein n=1 Tax=Lacticaseibacillus nasuensis JCM 17158 TaxID=1291734 RepID=A0A0R1K453_9LACO|nr:metal ABC transporter permease [Lacticaseibacillus nasuensis]KRK74055.1 cation ABC superfamily ATP binding cassette transporter, membrane protein [Lacticaseibacillus nasuensis JCM 17158]MCX2455943.1 metal ABC transporter permease [Lacticaseibacillus nasuensis]
MFAYEFMQNAFMASTFIAITCGLVGVFVSARGMSFLSHTLSEVGFAGAAFAVFAGISPLVGMLLFTIVSSIAVGKLSVKASRREASISAVSSLFVGLGILFLSLSDSSSSYATTILFGSIVGISRGDVWQLVGLAGAVLVTLCFGFRSLAFDSFDPDGARAQGLPRNLLSIYFLLILAVSVSIGAQIVGSLLVFILLTLPSAAAKYLGHTLPAMLAISVGAALIGVWLGLYLGYITNWPVTFFIAAIEFGFYFIALGIRRLRD